MSFWGRIFGTPEVIGKTTDAVIAAGDKIFYTDEEKAEAHQKTLDWVLKFHEASKGSNVARRLIAVMFTAVFLLLVLVTAAAIVMGATNVAPALTEFMAKMLSVPMSLIVGFYFSSGMVRDWRGK